jgi:transglutaminase-like putative cysteine protease
LHDALPWLLGSLALSLTALIGQVPAWALLLFAGCAGWRQWLEIRGGALPSIWVRLAVFLPMTGGVIATYGWHPGAPGMLTFLVALLSLKILELRSHRDFIVVALLGYFMILSAFFYDQALGLSLYMGIAVLANIVSLIRCHSCGKAGSPWPALKLATALIAQTLPVVALLFITFPRFEDSFLRRLGRNSTGMTGMSDHLDPGSFSSLAQSDEPVFRAKIVSGGTVPARNLYWRGLVLSACAKPMIWGLEKYNSDAEPNVTQGTQIEQQITLLSPQGERWLYALDRPMSYPPNKSLHPFFTTGNVLRTELPVSSKTIYLVSSDLTPEQSGDLSATRRAFYTRLPPDMGPRALALARRWRFEATGPGGKVDESAIIRAARLFFRDGGFTYTLSPGSLPGTGALDYFLFDSRRGFCEHYAAAFSSLMRAAGVPSRVVVGYQGGEYNSWGGHYVVRQSDAHAWSEVWIHGHGWQREDPTAVVAPERVSFGEEEYAALTADGPLTPELRLERLTRLTSPGYWRSFLRDTTLAWDGVDQQWNLLVLGYDREQRAATLDWLGLGGMGWIGGVALTMAVIFGFLGLNLVGVRSVDRRYEPRFDTAARLYSRFCLRVERATGLRRAPGEGPLGFAARVTEALPGFGPQISAITRLYVRSRYARSPGTGRPATLSVLRHAVAHFYPRRP